MVCPPLRGDNPRALARGFIASYGRKNHSITYIYRSILKTQSYVDGWMTCDFRSLSTVFQSGRWADFNERLCANGTPFTIGKVLASGGA